jgi:Domain of unknown function (DUF4349)
VSRDECNGAELAELAALDSILAREPVGEEHLELAALVDSVRANAPKIDAGFEARLAERFAGAPRRARWRVSAGRLAFAGGGGVAAAVALTIVLSGGVRHDLFGGGAPARVQDGIGRGSVPAQRILQTPGSSAHANSAPGPAASEHAGAKVLAPGPSAAAPAGGFGASRLVSKGSDLTLAAPPARIQGVADRVVAATEQEGGVVEHSDVSIHGSFSYATFSLSVPSGHLGPLLTTLSSLASVRSLNQSTQDITSSYEREQALLARRLAALASLRKQLATAASVADATALRKSIAGVKFRIGAERATIKRIAAQASNSTLQVEVLAGAAAAKHKHSGGALASAYHDALGALQEILAIALVALAIALPFALTALALWWAASGIRQRARERAIRAA